MKLVQVTTETVNRSTNRDLLNMHYQIHQIYRLVKLERSNMSKDILQEKHLVIVQEMKKRKIRHNTTLEQALEAIF